MKASTVIFKLVITLLTFVSFNTYANDSCQVNPPNWNWNQDSYEVIDDTPGSATIPSPFRIGYSYGISVAGQDHCYEDGWRLYDKKMSCTDFGENCTTVKSSSDEDFRPAFLLYNIHTANLRFFVHTRGFERNDEELLINVEMTHGLESESNIGLMLNRKTPIVALEDKFSQLNTSNEDHWSIYPSYSDKWVVFDQHLSYDPTLNNVEDNTRFTVSMSRRNTSSINIDGIFEFETNGTLKNVSSASKNIGISSLKNIYTSYGEPGQWASDLEKQGNKLVSSDSDIKAKAGSTLLTMAQSISDFSKPLGALNVANNVYSLLSGSSSKSSKSYINTYSTGMLEVEGAILDDSPIELVQFGVHMSDQDRSIDNSKLNQNGYSGKLGLISIKEQPKVVFKAVVQSNDKMYRIGGNMPVDCHDGSGSSSCAVWFTAYQYTLLNTLNFSDLISVNPSSKMVIKQVALQPVLNVPIVNDYLFSKWYAPLEEYNRAFTTLTSHSSRLAMRDCLQQSLPLSKCMHVHEDGTGNIFSGIPVKDVSGSGEFVPEKMYDITNGRLIGNNRSNKFSGDLNGNLKGLVTTHFQHSGHESGYGRFDFEIDNFFINAYVYLEHETNPDIHTEHKLRIPVTIGMCGGWPRDKHFDLKTGHDQNDFFTPSASECESDKKVLSWPTRGDQYSSTIRQEVWARSESANQICKEEFGTSSKTFTAHCAEDEESYSQYSGGRWKRKESFSRRCFEIIESVTCN